MIFDKGYIKVLKNNKKSKFIRVNGQVKEGDLSSEKLFRFDSK